MCTPILLGTELSKQDKKDNVDPTQFKKMVDIIMYLPAIRPNLMFAVSMINKYMDHSIEPHIMVVERIIKYLTRTIELIIHYKKCEHSELVGYLNSDYGEDVDNNKNILGVFS